MMIPNLKSRLIIGLSVALLITPSVWGLDAATIVSDATANLVASRSAEAKMDAQGNTVVSKVKKNSSNSNKNAASSFMETNTSVTDADDSVFSFQNVSHQVVLEAPRREVVELEEEEDDVSTWVFVDEDEPEEDDYEYFYVDMITGTIFENGEEIPARRELVSKDQPTVSSEVLQALLDSEYAQESDEEGEYWDYVFVDEDEPEDEDWEYFFVDTETGNIYNEKDEALETISGEALEFLQEKVEADEEGEDFDEDFDEEDEEEEYFFEFVDEEEPEDPDYEYFYIDEEQEGPGATFGVLQIVDRTAIAESDAEKFNESAVQENLEQAEAYMNNVVWEDEAFAPVRDLCFNYHPLCAAWAAHGECTQNEEFMFENCGPSCLSCEYAHFQTRCAADPTTDIFQPGDINKMFERIVSDKSYQTQVLSQPQESTNAPWILVIDDFFSAQEAQYMIDLGNRQGFAKSTISGGLDEETGEPADNVEDEAITSSTAWCVEECDDDEMVEELFYRMEKLTHVPYEHAEHMQLVRYNEGEQYLNHFDYVPYEQSYAAGPRMLTVLMYFNQVEEGGETYFNKLDLKIKPNAGRVVLWSNVLNDDPSVLDEQTEHQALPVIKGQKYVANSWHHLRNMQDAIAKGCN